MHGRGISRMDGAMEIVAVCDVDRSAAEAFASEFEVKNVYTDYREVLEDGSVEAVLVLLPHNLHREVCVAAADAGKHILVDKPIARTVNEAQPIVDAAERAGVTLMVGFNQRFMSVHRKIKELLDSGTIGNPFAARIDHHQDFRRPEGHWWRSKEAVGGGCVIGSGIHRLDLLRWFLGEPESVYALAVDNPDRHEAELVAGATIRFKNGAVGEFFCNWSVPKPFRIPRLGEDLSLFGPEGSIMIQGGELFLYHAGGNKGSLSASAPVIVDDRGRETMWQHFARCVVEQREPDTGGQEGIATLRFVEAIYRSVESGQPVAVEI